MKTHTFRRSRIFRKRKGQGLVEFALILPTLMLVLMAIIDMGWIAFNFSQLYNGVRESVRYGSVSGFSTPPQYLDCKGIADALKTQAGFSGINQTDSTQVTIYYDDGRPYPANNSRVGTCPYAGSFTKDTTYTPQGSASASPRNVQNGDRIVISVNAHVHFLTPFISTFAPNGLQLTFTTERSVFPNGLLARRNDSAVAQVQGGLTLLNPLSGRLSHNDS